MALIGIGFSYKHVTLAILNVGPDTFFATADYIFIPQYSPRLWHCLDRQIMSKEFDQMLFRKHVRDDSIDPFETNEGIV